MRTVARYADMWNAMGTIDVMKHKIEVLQGHCDAVGRDIAEIEFTLGVKVTIRDTEAEAVRVWKAAMEHNKTPLADVEDDDTFWNGTPQQLADRLRPVHGDRLPDGHLRAAGAVRRRDARALHRRGRAAHLIIADRPAAGRRRVACRPSFGQRLMLDSSRPAGPRSLMPMDGIKLSRLRCLSTAFSVDCVLGRLPSRPAALTIEPL